jgi:hypothetical protein
MNNRRRENLQEVAPGFEIVRFFGALVTLGVLVTLGAPVVTFGALGVPATPLGAPVVTLSAFGALVVGAWIRRRSLQAPAGLRTVLRPTPRTLRWVRGLLPGDEGAAWLVEVGSCLAEAQDKGERRRYVRSYRRNVPQLIWTSWAEHLSASRQRELL